MVELIHNAEVIKISDSGFSSGPNIVKSNMIEKVRIPNFTPGNVAFNCFNMETLMSVLHK